MQIYLDILHFSAVAVFIFSLIYAAFSDILTYTIPNWISVLILAAYPVAAFSLGESLDSIGFSFLSGFCFLFIGAVLFFAGLFGGGDVKLLAAVAVWTGFSGVSGVLLNMALSGGILSIAILAARKLLKKHIKWSWCRAMLSDDMGIPYGVAISFAALIFLFNSYVLPNI